VDHQGAVGVYRRIRWIFAVAAVLVVALVVSLIVRPIGAYFTPVDGWGVDALELTMGALCIARYFEGSWRASSPVARLFPLVIGVGCVAWGLGDVAITTESLGGATPSVPSVADAFYVCFFPLCFVAFALLIRRGNKSSLVATSLDGLIACLAVAAVSAAFVVAAVIRVTGGGTLAAVTGLAYPLGDILLLAVAIGGFAYFDGAGSIEPPCEGGRESLRHVLHGDDCRALCGHALQDVEQDFRAARGGANRYDLLESEKGRGIGGAGNYGVDRGHLFLSNRASPARPLPMV